MKRILKSYDILEDVSYGKVDVLRKLAMENKFSAPKWNHLLYRRR